jgi:hypothetical protein
MELRRSVANRSSRRPASSDAVLVGRWRSSFAKCGLVVAVAVVTAWAGVGAASAAPNECTTTGVTKSVVTKIFGAGAKATNVPVPPGEPSGETPICTVSPTGVTFDDCSSVPSCVNVSTNPTSYASLTASVANAVLRLKQYAPGREFEVAVPGAGSGAVLVEDTNYGPQSLALSPTLCFAGGAYTAFVTGSLTTARPSKKWEALARAVHAHLG